MTEFKVESSGWYRTRDGRYAEVVVNPKVNPRSVFGCVENEHGFRTWYINGHYHDYTAPAVSIDLVEYLGKERPKQKKVVRMAPALILEDDGGYHVISREIYPTEQAAKNDHGDNFVRWLIDTPYAVEVEVPDNG